MCFVWAWKTGFFASWMLLRLSKYMTIISNTSTCRSLRNLLSHMASHVTTATMRYLALVLNNVTVNYFLVLEVIAALRSENAKPDVDLRSPAFPAFRLDEK